MKTFQFSIIIAVLIVVFRLFFINSVFAREEKQSENIVSVENGLRYFRKRLDAGIMPGDGAFRNDLAITALVGMAFLSSGSTPTEGPDAQYVQRCITLILENVRSNGALATDGATEQGAIYAHGFAVTFLAECLGMSSEDERLRVVLEKAVVRIVQAQGENGGWRYSFQPGEEDVSVTACLLTALRACRNAGISVPIATIENGVKYLLRCQNPDGGFRYRLVAGPSAYPRTAAATVGICAAGRYDSPEIRQAMEYLKNEINSKMSSGTNSETDGYYFYAQYYAVQAFWLTAMENEKKAIQTVTAELLRLQKPDGTWHSALSIDYATAMSLIALQVETNYLPILQK